MVHYSNVTDELVTISTEEYICSRPRTVCSNQKKALHMKDIFTKKTHLKIAE